MTKLNFLDQAFYKLDKAGIAQVYMAGATVIDASAAPKKLKGQDVIDHLIARFESVPVLRKKIIEDPLMLGNVKMVDDPDFDFRDHFTLSTLDAPGDYEQLTAHLEEFSTKTMDLDGPLWQYEIIEGLEGGKIAIASQIHHSIMDGVGAVQMLGSIFDTESKQLDTPSNEPFEAEELPTTYEMIREGLSDSITRLYKKTPSFLSKNRQEVLKTSRRALANLIQPKDKDEEKPESQSTSLDVRASDVASVSFKVMSLPELKAVGKDLGYTINDLGLFICSVALEHYFQTIDEAVDFDLKAAVPVNVRTEDHGSAGNVLSGGIVSLHSTIKDPRKRLEAIKKENEELKQASRPKGDIHPSDILELIHPSLLDIAFFALSRLMPSDAPGPFNTVLSNVPGPREQIYIASAPVAYSIPMIPRLGGISCGLTSMSDTLTIGFHGCGKAIKDKSLLIEGVDAALGILASLDQQEPAKSKAGVKKKTATQKRARSSSRSSSSNSKQQ